MSQHNGESKPKAMTATAGAALAFLTEFYFADTPLPPL